VSDLKINHCGRRPFVKTKTKKRKGQGRLKTTNGIEFFLHNRQEKKEFELQLQIGYVTNFISMKNPMKKLKCEGK
jgi:hypothetical protein